MTHLEHVRVALSADAGVTALVGTRIYPVRAEQETLRPYIVLTTVSLDTDETLTGTVATSLKPARIQVDAYAETYKGAHALADAIDAAIGDIARPEMSIVKGAEQDLYDDETELRRVSMDFFVSM